MCIMTYNVPDLLSEWHLLLAHLP